MPILKNFGIRKNPKFMVLAYSLVEKLKKVILPYRHGSSKVYIRYSNGQAIADVNLGEEWNLTINDDLLDKLSASIGKENIKLDYNTYHIN